MGKQALHLESFVRPPVDRLSGRTAPCEKRLQRHREVLAEIARTKGEAAYYRALGELAQKDYWLFLRDVLLFEWVDPWFHGEEVCTFLAKTEGETRVILMPRGSGKSGMITIPMPAWRLARDPMSRVMVSNATEQRANKFARTTASIIANLPRYKKCFPHVVPDSKWGEGGYYLDISAFDKSMTQVNRADPSLACFGITSNITGSHVNGESIIDDLINLEIADSPKLLQAAEDFYRESLNCVDPGTTVTVCGTRWTYNDYYGKLVSGDLGGKGGPAHILKLGITRRDEHGNVVLIWPEKTYVDMVTKATRTVGYSWEFVAQQKKTQGPRYSALYENEPVADADRKFDVNLIKTYKQLPFATGRVQGVWLEVESQSQALYDGIRRVMQQEGRVFRLERVTSRKVGKKERISSFVGTAIADVRFNMPERIWKDNANLGEELRTYDKGSDDCLDATAYNIAIARELDGEPPRVFITVDPAFSVEAYSDWTAIVAGCVYEGEFWVLDCFRFRTDRVDVIARQIFRMFDKFHRATTSRPGRYDLNLQGFRSERKNGFYIDNTEAFFEVDDSQFYIGEKKNGRLY